MHFIVSNLRIAIMPSKCFMLRFKNGRNNESKWQNKVGSESKNEDAKETSAMNE